jgi:hypothetical protein
MHSGNAKRGSGQLKICKKNWHFALLAILHLQLPIKK